MIFEAKKMSHKCHLIPLLQLHFWLSAEKLWLDISHKYNNIQKGDFLIIEKHYPGQIRISIANDFVWFLKCSVSISFSIGIER